MVLKYELPTMKVFFANNYAYLRGGSERVLFEEMQLLSTRGVLSCIFSRQHPENGKWSTETFFPPHLEYDTGGISNKVKSAKELIYSRKVASSLRGLLTQESPDVLHAHNIYGRLTTSIFDSANQAGIPSVLTLHDYKLVCPSYLLMRDGQVCELCVKGSTYQCLAKRCHKGRFAASAVYVGEAYFTRFFKKYGQVRYFICPSRFLLNKHIEGGIPPEKLVFIPNAIDVAGFAPLFEQGKYILFVGRLSREKGIKTLLAAMIGLNIPLKIVGDGPLRSELETMVLQDKGITDVSFEGFRSGEELTSLFRNASFLVFPSEWYENAPMTILEAYGYGKPVIGADIGGIPEMIVDGETGLLFPPGNAEALRQQIEYLWSRPSLSRDMGKRARQRVEEVYNADIHLEKLLEVYRSAIA